MCVMGGIRFNEAEDQLLQVYATNITKHTGLFVREAHVRLRSS